MRKGLWTNTEVFHGNMSTRIKFLAGNFSTVQNQARKTWESAEVSRWWKQRIQYLSCLYILPQKADEISRPEPCHLHLYWHFLRRCQKEFTGFSPFPSYFSFCIFPSFWDDHSVEPRQTAKAAKQFLLSFCSWYYFFLGPCVVPRNLEAKHIVD